MGTPVKSLMPAVDVIKDKTAALDHIKSDPYLYHGIAYVAVTDEHRVEERTIKDRNGTYYKYVRGCKLKASALF